MLNKNDPLIGAVQEVMRKNQAERDAAKLVNEKFGVVDRRALPHEQQANWDTAYKAVLTEGVEALDEMSEKQKKLAKVGNKAGLGGNPTKIDAPDLEGARKGHAKHIEEEQIDEISGAMASRYLQAKMKRDYDKKGSMYTSKKSKSFKKMDKDIKGDIGALKRIERDKNKKVEEEQLEEKAVSKAQHRFFGLVRGIQKGTAHGSAKAEKAASSMSSAEVRKFAKTKEKGLPEKK